MKLKPVLFLFLLLLPVIPFNLPKTVKAQTTNLEPCLAMDMEQFIILDYESGVQRSWVFDSSPYRNHGEPLPYNSSGYFGPTKVRGVFGYALDSRRQDDYVNIADFQGLPDDEITVMAWIYGNSLTTDVYRRIVKHEWNANGSWILYIDGGSDPTLKFAVMDGGAQYTSTYSGLESGTWYHVVGVYNGSYVTCYVDGDEGTPAALSSATLDNDGTVRIDDTVSWFNGVIDEVKIFPFALTDDEVKLEMYSQIFVHRQNRWWEYYDDETGWDTTPNTDCMGFTSNDPTLPYVERSGDYDDVEIHRYDFIPGFQSYEMNAVFYDNVQDNEVNYTWGFCWDTYFFRNGEWESFHRVWLCRLGMAAYTAWALYSYYQTRSRYEASQSPVQTNFYVFHISNSENRTDFPFLIQCWTTEDSRQLAIRVAAKNTTLDGVGNYMFSYYYDLLDSDGNSRYLEWFDPWVVRKFSVRAKNTDGMVKVLRHNWDVIDFIIKTVTSFFTSKPLPIASMITQAIAGQEPTISEDVNRNQTNDGPPNPLFDPLGYISWQINHALKGIGLDLSPLVTAIKDLTGGAQEVVGTAILRFWDTFVDFLDTVFTTAGWPNGFSQLLSWVGSFLTWITNSFTYLISALTSTMTLILAIIGKLTNTLSTMVTQWVNIANGVFGALGDSYNTGINLWNDFNLNTWVIIFAILYPMFLFYKWEEEGFDAMLGHIKMVLDIFAFILNTFITIIQIFIAIVGRIIESIPVVE